VLPRLPLAPLRLGTTSPAAVINAAVAAVATEDELGRWLAKNWGVLTDTPPEPSRAKRHSNDRSRHAVDRGHEMSP